MCVIAICENRALTSSEFNECWDSNTHGMGFAFWNGSEITFKKGFMNKKDAKKAYKDIPVPHVVHFRIASAGEVCPELTHPFLCSKKSSLLLSSKGEIPVLFHNGTVGNYQTLLLMAIFKTKHFPQGRMSDSRAMAVAVSQVGPDLLDMYSSHKWVYVTKDGFRKVGDWIEEDGVFFSNYTFRRTLGFSRGSSNQMGLFGGSPDYPFPYTFERDRYLPSQRYRSCDMCAFYEGDMRCLVRGVLRDLVPCKEYKQLKTAEEIMETECVREEPDGEYVGEPDPSRDDPSSEEGPDEEGSTDLFSRSDVPKQSDVDRAPSGEEETEREEVIKKGETLAQRLNRKYCGGRVDLSRFGRSRS